MEKTVYEILSVLGGVSATEKGAWIADGRIIPWKAAGKEVLGGLWQELIPPPPPRYATSLGMFHTHPLDQVPEFSDEDRFFAFVNNVDWQCVATGKGHVCECYKKGNEYQMASGIAKKIISGEYDMDILGQKFREFESLRVKTTTSNPFGTMVSEPITGQREGGAKYRRVEYRLPIEQIRDMALNIKSRYKLPNIYLGGSQSPRSKHYPKRTSDIDLFSYFDTYEQLGNYARTVGKDTMELLVFVPRAGMAGEEMFMGRKVQLSISFMDLKPERIGVYDDQMLLDGGNLMDIAQKHKVAEKKTVYIAGMPEAQKDNRARMQELGNMLREGGYEVTGRAKSILTSNMRIHISNTPISELHKKSYVQEPGPKPNGFWYAFGTEWINELLITKIPKQKSGYIYEVDINNSNILQIKTEFEINKFTSEYGLSRETSVWSGTYIDWVRVSLKYDGIEINLPAFPDYREFPELRWFYGWDVASGCVWNLEKVKIELVGMLKDNVIRIQDTTEWEQKEPWQMTKEEFAKTAVPLPDRKDFIKAWLKDNEDIPDMVKPGFNYIEQRNGSLLVFGNQRGQAIGIISMRKDAVEHIAVSDRYKGRGIATQLLEESRKYGVRRVIGAISPEVAGIVHRFTVRTAFMEGKPVPQEVLREYPDLMMKAEKQKWRRNI